MERFYMIIPYKHEAISTRSNAESSDIGIYFAIIPAISCDVLTVYAPFGFWLLEEQQ